MALVVGAAPPPRFHGRLAGRSEEIVNAWHKNAYASAVRNTLLRTPVSR